MKKLIISLVIASSLPMVGMDTSEGPDKRGTKRPVGEIGQAETPAAKKSVPASAEVDAKQREEARVRVFNAIREGDLTGLQAALTYKPDIETCYVKDNEDLGTALQYALFEKHFSLPIVQTLLTHGANPNIITPNINWLPLHYAIDKLHGKTQLECVKMLLQAKANPNSMDTDDYGQVLDEVSPLIQVARSTSIEENALPLCKMLLQHGADINGQSRPSKDNPEGSSGITPLLGLCYSVENRIEKWYSPKDILKLTMKHKTLALLELLLDACADITDATEDIREKRHKSLTPLDIVSPGYTLSHRCDRATCSKDHIENIRVIHQSMLECIQTYITDRREDLRVTLIECYPGPWRDPAKIIADYLYAKATPKEIPALPSSTESTGSESASSGSAAAASTDKTLSLGE